MGNCAQLGTSAQQGLPQPRPSSPDTWPNTCSASEEAKAMEAQHYSRPKWNSNLIITSLLPTLSSPVTNSTWEGGPTTPAHFPSPLHAASQLLRWDTWPGCRGLTRPHLLAMGTLRLALNWALILIPGQKGWGTQLSFCLSIPIPRVGLSNEGLFQHCNSTFKEGRC